MEVNSDAPSAGFLEAADHRWMWWIARTVAVSSAAGLDKAWLGSTSHPGNTRQAAPLTRSPIQGSAATTRAVPLSIAHSVQVEAPAAWEPGEHCNAAQGVAAPKAPPRRTCSSQTSRCGSQPPHSRRGTFCHRRVSLRRTCPQAGATQLTVRIARHGTGVAFGAPGFATSAPRHPAHSCHRAGSHKRWGWYFCCTKPPGSR
eukprot:SAG25_NODE_17_length_24192_cov_70.399452_23_plen_201_part_00